MLTPAELQARTDTLLFPLDAAVNPWHTTGAAPLVMTYQFSTTGQRGSLPGGFGAVTDFSDPQKTAVRNALAEYAAVMNVQFVEATGAADPDFDFGRVGLGFPGGQGGFNYSYSSDGVTVTKDWDGYVVFDTSQPLNTQDQTQLILHEVGHMLGMKHPGNYDVGGNLPPPPFLSAAEDNNKFSMMSYNANPTNGFFSDNLMVYDIAAMQRRWGANMSYHTGNDVYTGPDGGRIQSIWDAGGADRIDASAQAGNVLIDLRPGYFSSVGATDNLIVSYGVRIENATGGAGNDTITGNSSANVLDGGAGNDTINAGAGNDTLIGGAGNDTMIGGSGIDTASYAAAGAGVSVNLGQVGPQNTVGAGTDTIAQMENAIGSNHADTLRGNSLANVLNGGGGHDQIFGGANNDTIVGGGGNDRIDGGDGQDRLYADGGADTFVFGGLAGARDVVFGFQSGLHDLEVDASGFGGAAYSFTFRAGGNPLAPSATRAFLYDTDDGKLYFDADGSGAGVRVHVVTLAGAPVLTGADILLV